MDRALLPVAITCLSRAESLRDFGTNTHERRMALMMQNVGLGMGLPTEECRDMAVAGLLHDIGKIGVPLELLQKTTPLTREEMALIRTHSRKDHEILRATSDRLMLLASEIALHHHERHDGSGYPDGLVGAKIPLPAQIAAVCDVYDALRQNRPYRHGMSHDDAMRTITQGDNRTRPEHFAPPVMAAFCLMSEKARSIFDRFDAGAHASTLLA